MNASRVRSGEFNRLLAFTLCVACAASPDGASSATASATTARAAMSSTVTDSAAAEPEDLASALFEGRAEAQLLLARAVTAHLSNGEEGGPGGGSARIRGEWAFATHQLAVIGLAQVIAAHPETKAELGPFIGRAAEAMTSRATLAFATEAWGGEVGLDSLASHRGHAYLGYAALALCMESAVDPASPRKELAAKLATALRLRVEQAKNAVFETYPGETYPPDMALVYGAVALCGRVFGEAPSEAFRAKLAAFEQRYVDARSGLLIQRVDAATGAPKDQPRASGTALAAFALAFADQRIAAALGEAVDHNTIQVLGRAGVREYAEGADGPGDADSGQLVLGVSPVATGFAIGSTRIRKDRDHFVALLETAETFGDPEEVGGARYHRAGGALGDAALLAMSTAGPFVAPR